MEKLKETKGRTSPRWAFWERMTIPCLDGLVYLVRLRVIQTPLFALYVHDIHEPDGDRAPHNHPWTFISIVLRGHYTEHVHVDPDPERKRVETIVEKTHKRFSIHKMPQSQAHTIVEAGPNLKTLILTGRRRSSWGFFTDKGYVDWKVYTKLNPR